MRGLCRRRVAIVVVPVALCALLAAGAAWATSFYGEVIHIQKTSLLYDVGCGTQSTCLGVGTDNNNAGLVVNAVTRKVTDVAGTSYLSHIDCPKKNYCIAVGTQTAFSDGVIVEIQAGSPGGAVDVGYQLYGIACGTASSCWVPGAAQNTKGMGTAPVLIHLVNGKIAHVIENDGGYWNYPYLFTVGEGGGALTCFPGTDHCIIAGKLSNTGPGALFSLDNGNLTLLTKVSDMTAVSGIWCFSADLCRITGYNSSNQGVFATFHNGKVENAGTFGNYLGALGCLNANNQGPDRRCFAFGSTGTYPNISSVVVKLKPDGTFADSQVIEPFITGTFCSHTCISAGSVGQYPKAEGVFFDKYVH